MAALFKLHAGSIQLLGNQVLIGKNGLILGGGHFIGKVVERIVRFGSCPFRTENEPNRGFRRVSSSVFTRVN